MRFCFLAFFPFVVSAETLLFSTNGTGRLKFDAAVPASLITAGDRSDGEVSFWAAASSVSHPRGWTWTFPTGTNKFYLTDGVTRSPLINPVNEKWGDLGPVQPDKARELRFKLPSGWSGRTPLRLTHENGAFIWGGDPHGPISLEVWKGVRAKVSAWVDQGNRCAFVDASTVPAVRYEFTVAGETFIAGSPVKRFRLAKNPRAFTVKVRAFTRKEGVFEQTVKIVPRQKASLLKPLVPDGRVLVGQCVYGSSQRFRDEIVTNQLADLIVGWNKGADFTNLPPMIAAKAKADDVHFMTIYGYDHRPVTDTLSRELGPRYLWNNIGEFAGFLYQSPKEASACRVPQGLNLAEARDWFIDRFIRTQARNRHADYDYILSTSGSPLGAYEMQGGMDYLCCELYAVGAGNLAYATSEMRGAAKKWGPAFWGGWLAEEWQTFPVPYDSEQKYDLLLAGMRQQYLMGTSVIVLESGAQGTQAHQYTARANKTRQGYDEPAPAAYRRSVKAFYDWVRENPRAGGLPEVPVALALGNCDAFVGMLFPGFAQWGQHGNAATNKNWRCGLPEETWASLQGEFFPVDGTALKPFPNNWLAGTPHGQTDVISIDDACRLDDLTPYHTIIFGGWNSMTPRMVRVLDAYVRQGGNLLLGVAHCNTRLDREFMNYTVSDLVNGGDLRPLLAARVLRREGDTAVLDVPSKDGFISQRRGRGSVTLFTGWLYPGRNNERAKRYIARAASLAEAAPRKAKIFGPDVKCFNLAVYGKTAYLLNIDTVKSRSVNLAGQSVTLKPAELRVYRYRDGTWKQTGSDPSRAADLGIPVPTPPTAAKPVVKKQVKSTDFKLYYGAATPGAMTALAAAKCAVVDPTVFCPDAKGSIAGLRASGTVVYGYVSLLEATPADLAKEGVREDWVIRIDGKPWHPWGDNVALDISRQEVRDWFTARVTARVVAAGCDGAFMDTLADLDHPGLPAALREPLREGLHLLLQQIHRTHDTLKLASNWTLQGTLPIVAPYVSAVCWENFDPGYFTNGSPHRAFAMAVRKKLEVHQKTRPFAVWALAEKVRPEAVPSFIKGCVELGYIPGPCTNGYSEL